MLAALTTMVRMFGRVGWKTNLDNIKGMTCTLVFILGQQVNEAYKRKATGEEPNFWKRSRTRISSEVCGGTMSDSSLRQYMEIAQGKLLM